MNLDEYLSTRALLVRTAREESAVLGAISIAPLRSGHCGAVSPVINAFTLLVSAGLLIT